MTLATRCPACGTAFRVVSDQLRVSSGWVRCGRCGSSFDALEHLFRHAAPRKPAASPTQPEDDQAPPVATPMPLEAPTAERVEPHEAPPPEQAQMPERKDAPEGEPEAAEPVPEPVPETVPEPVSEPAFAPASEPVSEPVPEPAAPNPEPAAEPAPEPLPEPVLEPAPEPAVEPVVPELPPEPGPEPKPELLPEPAVEPAHEPTLQPTPEPTREPIPEPAPEPRPQPSAASAQAVAPSSVDWVRQSSYQPRPSRPSFLRRAEAAARWSHPATRMTLGLLAAVLAALLAAQAALLWRDELALRWPATRAALETACAALQCRVEAPRRIQWLDVPASELLSEADGATYRLEVSIRNRGSMEVLAPAIELTLTGTSGQLLARRVLTLAELGHAARSIGPGQELLVRGELVTGSTTAAGYNIALFYP